MQIAEEEPIRVPTLQEQDGDCTNHHPLRSEADVPGAGIDERCDEDVHQEKRC